jgi:hypothetical protein
MPELILNVHMHTTYSDGSGSHKDLADAALETGVDVIIVTDHNVYVQGVDGYHRKENRQVLLLAGEEVHDATRLPQKSHLLVFGAGREMVTFAKQPQRLIDQVTRAGGLAFLAHPNDDESKPFHEDDISWVDWDVRGFTGIELWNGFSEIKTVAKSRLQGIFYAFFPHYLAHAPHPKTLKRWDELTNRGQKVVAICGADAHALKLSLGPLRRTVFPYTYHFRALNNHLLVDSGLTGDLVADRQMVYDALRKGNCYIGYDLPASTTGFRFSANGDEGLVQMGSNIRLGGKGHGVTLQIKLPGKAECRLLCNGALVQSWDDREVCTYVASQPGTYRVECSIDFLGQKRGWIFSNPIYII